MGWAGRVGVFVVHVCRCRSPELRGWGGSFLGQNLFRTQAPPTPSAERGSGWCDISCQLRQASRRQLMPHTCLSQRRCRKRRKWRRGEEVRPSAKSFKAVVESGEGGTEPKSYWRNASRRSPKGHPESGHWGRHGIPAERGWQASQWSKLPKEGERRLVAEPRPLAWSPEMPDLEPGLPRGWGWGSV